MKLEWQWKSSLARTDLAKEERLRRAAKAFGELLHAVQDSYSHRDAYGNPMDDRTHKADIWGTDDPAKRHIEANGAWNETAKYMRDFLNSIKDECSPCQ